MKKYSDSKWVKKYIDPKKVKPLHSHFRICSPLKNSTYVGGGEKSKWNTELSR